MTEQQLHYMKSTLDTLASSHRFDKKALYNKIEMLEEKGECQLLKDFESKEGFVAVIQQQW